MNAVSKFILHCADICKPILLKIIPVKILRKMKGKMISDSFGKLSEMQICPYEADRKSVV